MRITWVLLPCLLGLVSTVFAAPRRLTELPVEVPEASFRPLYDSVDRELERRLRATLDARPEWRTLVQRKKLAVGVVDLSEPGEPRFARVNGNLMMYAASLPKIGILLAAYESFEDGSLPETEEIHQELGDMIRVSSNVAATNLIDRIGFEKIGDVLRRPEYQLYDAKRGGGIWVGKRYAKEGRRYPDPLHGISHAATVTQVCRFYYLLATGQVINAERSEQMLLDLADPGLHHKFVGVLEERAPRARLFRKSGTWKIWHSDSVLVWGPDWRRYILVAMVESARGDAILRNLVAPVEGLLRRRPETALAARTEGPGR